MNERIRELALQAGVFAGDFAGAGLYSIHNKEEVEKFADLLLSRVCEICEDLGDRGLDGHYCVDKIRREFV